MIFLHCQVPQSFQPRAQTNRKAAGLVRPSSGYYGNGTTKRLDSDNESYVIILIDLLAYIFALISAIISSSNFFVESFIIIGKF